MVANYHQAFECQGFVKDLLVMTSYHHAFECPLRRRMRMKDIFSDVYRIYQGRSLDLSSTCQGHFYGFVKYFSLGLSRTFLWICQGLFFGFSSVMLRHLSVLAGED